jgi:hypothetical protein
MEEAAIRWRQLRFWMGQLDFGGRIVLHRSVGAEYCVTAASWRSKRPFVCGATVSIVVEKTSLKNRHIQMCQ